MADSNWLDKLAALRESMPDDSADNKAEETEDLTTGDVKPSMLDISFEKKGRGGKTATIISGFGEYAEDKILKLASELKQKLATGGSARGGEILVQGDRRNDVADFLKGKGFKCRII